MQRSLIRIQSVKWQNLDNHHCDTYCVIFLQTSRCVAPIGGTNCAYLCCRLFDPAAVSVCAALGSEFAFGTIPHLLGIHFVMHLQCKNLRRDQGSTRNCERTLAASNGRGRFSISKYGSHNSTTFRPTFVRHKAVVYGNFYLRNCVMMNSSTGSTTCFPSLRHIGNPPKVECHHVRKFFQARGI